MFNLVILSALNYLWFYQILQIVKAKVSGKDNALFDKRHEQKKLPTEEVTPEAEQKAE
jgi:hypothetical protein